MIITEKLLKPVSETTYLTAENVKRYRTILRFFYMQYEKIQYWMNQDEIYEEMRSHAEFADYTMEQCRQDLNSLVGWNNLMPIQDTKKVTSVDAFKNRQFRYQLTEYTVEIERMVIKLENIFVEGASLEPTLLERIKIELEKIEEISRQNAASAYTWWNSLNNDFIRLNQNYQDYMRQLSSAKAEELMKTKEFLVFKDKLIEYLRSFVKGLQMNTPLIESQIIMVEEDTLNRIFKSVLEYEMSIPRIEIQVEEKDIQEKIWGRWISLKNWFVGEKGGESEASRLFDMTNESIRKITRYATQISEQLIGGANRKEEYKQLAGIFAACGSIKEAHKLSAVVFGVEKPLHLKGEFTRNTDSINSSVYDEEPCYYSLVPRIRGARETFERSFIRDFSEEKATMKKLAVEKIKAEAEMVNRHIENGRLDFSKLSIIEPTTRNVMLRWLSKALENPKSTAKTDEGVKYVIINREETEICKVRCLDGEFEMPAFVIEFEDCQKEEVGEQQ